MDTAPIVGASVSQKTPMMVPIPRATKIEGTYRSYRRGQSMATARVTAAMPSALTSKCSKTSEKLRSVPIGPPAATGAPRKGRVWTRMMITPTPVMNPEMTE